MRSFTNCTVDFAMGDTRSAPSLSTPVKIARLIHDLGVALLQRLQIRDHHLGHLLLQIAIAHAAEVRAHLLRRAIRMNA